MSPRALVVAESLTGRMDLGEILRRAGFTLSLVSTAPEAGLVLAQSEDVALVVADLDTEGLTDALAGLREATAARGAVLWLFVPESKRGTLPAGTADRLVPKPWDPEVLEREAAAVCARRTASAPRRTVLVVDDSPTHLHSVEDFLVAGGFDVTAVGSGEEAFSVLEGRTFDAVVLDMQMPGLSGVETCRRIKQEGRLREMPLLMMTAREDAAALMESLSAGADDFVAKSADLGVLMARLETQLRRKHADDEARAMREQLLRREMEAREARAAQRLAETRALLVRDLEKKNAELEAARREAVTILESISDGFFAVDADGRITYVNREAERLLGEHRENLLGRDFREQLPDGAGALVNAAGEARGGDTPVTTEFLYRPLATWLEGHVYPSAAGVSVYLRDVTERHRHQEEQKLLAQASQVLVESLDIDETLSRAAKVGVPSFADLALVIVPRRGEEALAAAAHRDPALAQLVCEALDGDDADHAERGIGLSLRTGQQDFLPELDEGLTEKLAPTVGQLGALQRLRLRSMITVPLAARGRTLGAIAFGRIERAFDEESVAFAVLLAGRIALALSNALLFRESEEASEQVRLLLDSTAEGIYGLDEQGHCTFANRAALDLFGCEREEDLLGQNMHTLVHHSCEDGTPIRQRDCRVYEVLQSGTRVHVTDEVFWRRGGGFFNVEYSAWPVLRGGKVSGAVVTFIDVSVRRRAEAERDRAIHDLREAVVARDDFLSIASHELKTPLTPLRLQLQQLLRAGRSGQPLPTDRVVRGLEGAERQVSRLTRLINNLLDISRLTAGRLQLEPETVNLTSVISEVLGRFQEELANAGSAVNVRGEESVVGLWDRLRLDQIVTNLLSNAVKYGQGRPIDIEVSAEGERAVLSVRDRGIGIAPDDQARIFERFERAVSGRHFSGFGLGLWIVRQIVDALEGEVHVESTPGEGSTFTVVLPLRPAALRERGEEPRAT